MLFIYTHTPQQQQVEDALALIPDLETLVEIRDLEETDNYALSLQVEDAQIHWPLAWHNLEPPILFPSVAWNAQDFLSMILAKLGHFEPALEYAVSEGLKRAIQHYICLLEGNAFSAQAETEEYIDLHNQAVLSHYTNAAATPEEMLEAYQKAMLAAPELAQGAFTAKHYAIFLSDQRQHDAAQASLYQYLESNIPRVARFSLKTDLIALLMKDLEPPFEVNLMNQLKGLIAECIQYFELVEQPIQVALLLIDASEIANIDESYSESLGYISRAISLLEGESVPEFLGNAFMRKGALLYSWAQAGQSQFYQAALKSFQQALSIFRKDTAPAYFAEIHHYLGIIYTELPAEEKKKGLWSALSASSFQESLSYFDKERFPYRYAMIVNNYANALMKYPQAKNGDHHIKALYYYEEALEVQSPEAFPLERAHTLLNYLEACWRVDNVNTHMERLRHKDMLAKAKEVKSLVNDQVLYQQAEEHLEKLTQLGELLIQP